MPFASARPHARARSRAVLLTTVAALLIGLLPAPTARAGVTGVTELFFSEYIEGSSNNKALEIYNGTGASVNLGTAGYSVQMFFNGSGTAGLTINLTGTVADGDVYVVAQSSASATILAQADQTNGSGWFNGDDAVVLRHGTTVVDAIGQVGVDPGTEWGTGLTSTADNTLRRKAAILAGDANSADAFDPSIEWDGLATDTFDGLGAHTATPPEADSAPAVAGSSPANGAADVSASASPAVTFSEPVAAGAGAFAISCSLSGAHPASVTGGPTTWSIDPATDFTAGETCTLTVSAAEITDLDATDPPDQMAMDVPISFTITDAVCGAPSTPIHAIQGTGATSPVVGSVRSIEGIVVADYQAIGQFSGYYVEEEDADADADPLSSEGIFVFNTSNPVAVGDHVRVKGTVVEFASSGQTLTELGSVSSVLVCSTGNPLPAAAPITLPFASLTAPEAVEGMLVSTSQSLTVSEVFTLARFGEVVLSSGGRLHTPTAVADPGAPAQAVAAANELNQIVLDDGNNQQNIDPTFYPTGGLSAANTLRVGDSVGAGTFVLEQRFGVYRLQRVQPVTFTHDNPRPADPPAVGGTLRVGAFNVLNYFNGDGTGGGFPTARGATTLAELDRQRAKEVSAIRALDAAVLGLMELENDDTATGYGAIEDLVDGLNAGDPDRYAFIDTGIVGTDAIRVGILYQPALVTPEGAFAVLDSSVDPTFIDTKNRPSIAQSFSDNATGAVFTVVVNHLKSKGSDCNDLGDPDTGDGQGNCNETRTAAALALVNWLAGDPTNSGDPDVILVGDMNSYAKEDPIRVFESAGYVNLFDQFLGAEAYSYVFDAQTGYLDHALASASLVPQVTGAGEWHINADEPIALDYNTEFKSLNQVTTFYSPDPYRSSDHDPLLVGLVLNAAPTVDAGGPYVVVEGGSVTVTATGADANGDDITYAWDLDGNGSFETAGASATFDASAITAPATRTISVQVTDELGLTGVDSATVRVIYPFSGFLAPIDPGVVNTVKAGAGVPVRFSLDGDRGLAILAAGYPTSIAYPCNTAAPTDAIESTVASGGSGLAYDAATDTYTYVWKTSKAWAGTCRLFVLRLNDGQTYTAAFAFLK